MFIYLLFRFIVPLSGIQITINLLSSAGTPPKPDIDVNPCLPSPCGPYSQCHRHNDQAVCSCQDGYFGTPPNCRPECLVPSDCAKTLTCLDQHCADPCEGSCGINTQCRVRNHNPVCSCRTGYEGDPFTGCSIRPSTSTINSIAVL